MISLFKTVLIIPLSIFAVLAISGCAEINPFETPTEIIRQPFGPESIRIGMGKNEVISKWGEPDIVNKIPTENLTASQGEEWVYKSERFTPLPLDSGYLNKNVYLYFDGNNLARMSSEPGQEAVKP